MTTTFKQKLTRIGVTCAIALGCTGAATTTALMSETHEPQTAYADGWEHTNDGWRYLTKNGYAKASEIIDGELYEFTPDGILRTNCWFKPGRPQGFNNPDATWAYLDSSGRYIKGWQWIDSHWYYFGSVQYYDNRYHYINDPWMQTSWKYINNNWYYFGADGAMRTGWQWIGSKWYYFNKSGAMQTGWQSIGGKWYYFDYSSGAMATGWQNIYGKWYYFDSSGAMQTGWQKIAGKWYYLNKSGEMIYGWQYIGGKWYHFNNSGAMDANKWVGNYYVKSDGSMATNQKIGQYYVGADGLWDGAKTNKDSLHIETNSYTIDLPASWKDKVSYTTEGDTTRVYIPGYSAHQQTAYYLFEVSASTTAPVPFTQNGYTVTILGKTQTGKTVSLASLDYINLTYSNYGNHRPDFDSETKKLYSKYIDLQTHGAITFEQVKNNPNSYVTTTYFKDFMNKEVIPAIKLRN